MEPEENPFAVQRPEQHAVGAANEVYCWMPNSGDRECNATCVAYDPSHATEGKSCEVLNHLAAIVDVMSRRTGLMKKLAVDQQIDRVKEAIEKIPPPPEVR